MINFGWAVLVSTLLGIFLQEKEPKGYGFTPQRAAGCRFSLDSSHKRPQLTSPSLLRSVVWGARRSSLHVPPQ